MTTAFVAGATGYTGLEVVRQLAASGVRTIAHVRPDSPELGAWRKRFARMDAEVDTSAWDATAMTAALRGSAPNLLFALLGTTKSRARSAKRAGAAAADYETVDYGMTNMLLCAAQTAAPSTRFIYLSSLGARTDTRNDYLYARGRIEAELMTSGLTWVIARPAIISGSDRGEKRVLERAFAVAGDAVLSGFSAVGVSSFAQYRSITAAELARALIHAARDPAAANRALTPGDLHRRASL